MKRKLVPLVAYLGRKREEWRRLPGRTRETRVPRVPQGPAAAPTAALPAQKARGILISRCAPRCHDSSDRCTHPRSTHVSSSSDCSRHFSQVSNVSRSLTRKSWKTLLEILPYGPIHNRNSWFLLEVFFYKLFPYIGCLSETSIYYNDLRYF